MRKINVMAALVAIGLWAGCTGNSVGDGEYLIEGLVRNIPDSTVINLFKNEGRMMSLVVSDTVIGGRFEFRDTISGGPARFGLVSFSKGFPNLPLPVWVKHGEKVKVTGEDNLLLTWMVKSRIPEQKTENEFLAVQFPEKRRALAYAVEEADILKGLRGLQGEERRAAWRKVNSLRRLYEPLDSIAEHKVLEYMRTAPVTARWMDELAMVARAIRSGYMSFDNDLIQELYSRLSPEVSILKKLSMSGTSWLTVTFTIRKEISIICPNSPESSFFWISGVLAAVRAWNLFRKETRSQESMLTNWLSSV